MKNDLTPSAAIIELNRCKVSSYMPVDWERRRKAVDMAIEALKEKKSTKQEAIKPVIESDFFSPSGIAEYCPVCESFVSKRMKYCQECGQALDWSEG